MVYCVVLVATKVWSNGCTIRGWTFGIGALGYFIAIPDVFVGVGYTDDLGMLAAAATAIAVYMKPEHSEKAQQAMKQWFG